MNIQDIKVGDTVTAEYLEFETITVAKVIRASDDVAGWEGTFSITIDTGNERLFIAEGHCDVLKPNHINDSAYLVVG
tara:strand:- start:460 stop:690 length:231 start_codon:yes stop_codon:yes gene_type:complete